MSIDLVLGRMIGFFVGSSSTLIVMCLAVASGRYNKKVEEHDNGNNN